MLAERFVIGRGRGAVKFRHRRTVVCEPGGEEPGAREAILQADGLMPGVPKVGVRSRAPGGVGTNRDIYLPVLFPVLPAAITNQRQPVRDRIIPTGHNRLGDGLFKGGFPAEHAHPLQGAPQSRTHVGELNAILVGKIHG